MRQAMMRIAAILVGVMTLTTAGGAMALDEVSFGTNWLAEAEHGGFYQALADGTYEKYGLKVTIVQGGPQAANRALMLAGKTQFYMAGNLLKSFSAAQEGVPVVEIAAIFQKEPQVLIAHPESGIDTLADFAKVPAIFMGRDGFASYFQWMKSVFPGFRDEQYKPYTFNSAPFLADKKSAQQGYISSDPFEIERQAGFKPKVFLLADYGFSTYSTMIETTRDYLARNPDIAKRFVEASIIGWYNYLYGDNSAANALIKKDNPEMTDEQIAFSVKAMKEHGIVDSGETLQKGIGCMTPDRIRSFYDAMVKAGVVKADLDISQIYSTAFVCQGLGVELRK